MGCARQLWEAAVEECPGSWRRRRLRGRGGSGGSRNYSNGPRRPILPRNAHVRKALVYFRAIRHTRNMDADVCYRAVQARDARFDGLFFTGVRTTRIFCRPVCPAKTPLRKNVEFFANAPTA